MVNFSAQLLGTKEFKKSRENANQKVKHVESFIDFMSGTDSDPPANLEFLDNTLKLYDWVRNIKAHFKVTTCRHYLMDVVKFLDYLLEEQPAHVRLRRKWLLSLKKLVKEELKVMAGDVVMHRQVVKATKRCRILARETLQELLTELRERILFALGQS